MTGPAPRGPQAQGRPERRSTRMVLDVDFALDGLVADLLRAELDQGVEVHVVLLRPRRGWSTDAALVALHRRRINSARSRQLEELAHIAGARHRQVTVSIQRHRWRSAAPSQSLASYLTPRPDQEGTVPPMNNPTNARALVLPRVALPWVRRRWRQW